jgi:hypothetical protein
VTVTDRNPKFKLLCVVFAAAVAEKPAGRFHDPK